MGWIKQYSKIFNFYLLLKNRIQASWYGKTVIKSLHKRAYSRDRAAIETRARRRTEILNINNENLCEQQTIDSIRNSLMQRHGNEEICKSLSEFEQADPDTYYNHFFQWAKKNETIMFSTPPAIGSYDFQHLMHAFD